jgi:hypothetical protein
MLVYISYAALVRGSAHRKLRARVARVKVSASLRKMIMVW